MTWANDDEARALLARPKDQATPLECAMLKVARAQFRRIEAVRVIGMPQPGHALVCMRTDDRVGHAKGGYVGLGTETEAVAAANLAELAEEVALELREKAGRNHGRFRTIMAPGAA